MILGRRGRPFLVGALALLLGACAAATPPPAGRVHRHAASGAHRPALRAPRPRRPPVVAPAPAPLSPRQQLAAGHKDRARRLERSGDLRQALDEWKIALTIDPDDQAAQEGRRQLEARMERSVAERLGQGREALGKGDHLEARRHFLAVLAIDPANQAAFSALQNDVKEIRFVPHTVKAGETLATIAERYYGDRARSEVIWETNQLPPNPRLTRGHGAQDPGDPRRSLRPAGASPEAAGPGGQARRAHARPGPVGRGGRDQPAPRGSAGVAREGGVPGGAGRRGPGPGRQRPEPRRAELKKAVLYGLGKSQLGQRKYEESVRTLVQLARLAPTYQDSPALLKQARERAAQQHYAQGLQLYREEKLEDAIAQWKTVLEYEPEHVNAKKNIEQAERLLKSLQQRQQPKKP